MGQYLRYREGYVKRANRLLNESWLQTREIVYHIYTGNVTKASDLRTREQLIPLASDQTRKQHPASPAEEASTFIEALNAHTARLQNANPTP